MDRHLSEIEEKGYTILPAAFRRSEVDEMRNAVLSNVGLMSNTRPAVSALHIAGFHRFPNLEALHNTVSSNADIRAALGAVYREGNAITIGLSDITINRSQPWHTDLLRGRYSSYLPRQVCWPVGGSICVKALVYLQDGQSLRVVAGSHKVPIDLADDRYAIPRPDAEIETVETKAGDAILMDIRLIHRGSIEADMADMHLLQDTKILISTVFGDRYSEFAQSMQIGNVHRLIDWDNENPISKYIPAPKN